MAAESEIRVPQIRPLVRPWLFVPILYFMQAVPVTIVQEVATIFYKDLGIANNVITQWTSIIALPWSLQFLLGPMVDLNGPKRSWIFTCQMLIAVGLALVSLALRLPHCFEISLVILGSTAILSAVCNIATDGFYLLTLTRTQQTQFVGIQTMFYRLGKLFCAGLLVFAVGLTTSIAHVAVSAAWTAVLLCGALIYLALFLVARRTTPSEAVEAHAGEVRLKSHLRGADSWERPRWLPDLLRTLAVIGLGLGLYFLCNALVRLSAHCLWSLLGSDPEGRWRGWMLPQHDTILSFDLGIGGVATELLQSAFAASVAIASCLFVRRSMRGTAMGEAFGSFVSQSGFWAIFGFILFYRFGEAMVGKMSPLFLKDAVEKGGLAVTNQQIGLIKGVAGVLGIVCGGIVGGLFVSRRGLKRSLWPMAILMHIPNLLYLWASLARPSASSPLLYVVDFLDQFGYGFGFAGYSIYLMWVAQRGRFTTAHYAIGTGMGALCIVTAGVVSGVIQSNFGYPKFFVSVIFFTIPGMLMLTRIPLDDVKSEAA